MLLALGLATSFIVVSCGDDDEEEGGSTKTYKDAWAHLVNEKSQSFNVSGNTMTYGSHTYTVSGNLDPIKYDKDATGKVTFTNIPSGYTEFQTVYNEFLGKKPQGIAAMSVMAMEIYARNPETGEKCFELLCNNNANVKGIVRTLKQKFVPSEYAPDDDKYIQRYLPAALLEGASYSNAYKPNEPYTVNVKASSNPTQELKISTEGWVSYLYVDGTGGWDTVNRGLDVYAPIDGELLKCYNMPSLYAQCRNIRGTWEGLK